MNHQNKTTYGILKARLKHTFTACFVVSGVSSVGKRLTKSRVSVLATTVLATSVLLFAPLFTSVNSSQTSTSSIPLIGSILPQSAKAQTPNTTLNFQARILLASGALVPDGNYNLEFKIYDSTAAGGTAQGVCSLNSSTDDCWWLETRTGANVVRVVNGYVSVNLGSVTAFGSSIPWSQDLYVVMRVGGIGTPSWDATEMVNATTGRMKISAVPLAFVANNVRTANRTSAASDNITIQTGTTTTSGNSGNITIDTGTAAGTAGTISVGTTTQSGLLLGRAGSQTTITGSSILLNSATMQRTAAGTTNLNLVDGSNTILSLTNSGAGNLNLTVDGTITVATAPTVSSFSTAGVVTNNSSGVLASSASLGVALGGTGTTTAFTTGSIVFAGASGVYAQDNASLFFDDTNNRLGIGTATTAGNRLTVNNNAVAENIFVAQDNGAAVFTIADGGTVLAGNTAGATSRTAAAVAQTNVTTVTITVAGFTNGDVIFINNAGQDYYTRVTAGGGTTSLTVDPAVSYDASAAIQNYNIQNIGAASTGTTFADSSRYFQGFFLGGVRTGAGSTTLSDQNLTSTQALYLNTGGANTRVLITNTGNVGVGTSGTPSQLLSVGGTTGNLTVDASGTLVTSSSITGSRLSITGNLGAALGDILYGQNTTFDVSAYNDINLNLDQDQGTSPNASNLNVVNGTGSTVLTVSETGLTNSAVGFSVAGVSGSTTTCSGGQIMQNQVVSGGVVTGGTCSAAGTGTITGSGTANQVAYFSGTSAITSGAALTYNGGQLAVNNTSATIQSTFNVFANNATNTANTINVRGYTGEGIVIQPYDAVTRAAISVRNSAGAYMAEWRMSGEFRAPDTGVGHSFLTDTDTGLGRTAADTIALYTGNVARLVVASSGNVSIGSTTTNNLLSVNGSAVFGGTATTSSTEPIELQGSAAGISYYDRVNGTGAANRWVEYATGGAFNIWNNSVNRFSINTSGNATISGTLTVSGATATVNGSNILTEASNGNVVTGIKYFQSNLGATSGSLTSPQLQVYATGGNAAFMSFHRSGAYAINMGLDSDNILRIGGWSAAAGRWTLDGSGNQAIAGSYSASGTSINLTNTNTLFFGDGTNTASRSAGSYYVQSVGGAATHAILGSTQYFNGRVSIQGTGAACSQPANGSAGIWYADAGDCGTIFVGISTATDGGELFGIWTNGWDWQTDTGGTTYQSGNIFYNGNIWNDAQTTVGTNNGTVCWDPGNPFGGADSHDQYARCSSIRALKTNIVDLPYGLSAIRQLQPRQFDWISSGLQDFGFIADEVEAIDPMFAEYDGNGTLTGVHYLHMSALMAQGIKELDVQVQANDTRLSVLEQGELSGNLHVALDTQLDGTLTVLGDTTLTNLTVSGNTEVQNLTVNGKIITAGATPTIVLGAQATGQGAVSTVTGNDTAGTVTYEAGIQNLPSNPLVAGEQVSVAYVTPFAQAPRIALTAKDAGSAAMRYYVETTATGFVIHFIDTPITGVTYTFDYIVIQ